MLNRFIGNKKPILQPLLHEIEQLATPDDLVCDIFSGTLAVSLALKSRGFRVASNDINLFSYVYGRAFLTNSDVPAPDVSFLTGSHPSNTGPSDDNRFQAILEFLASTDTKALPGDFQRTHIFDTYSEAGHN